MEGKILLLVVNDRAGKNRARPNRAGSAIFTEGSAGGSAEPQVKSSHNFGTFWYFFSSEKRVLFTIYLHMFIHVHLLHSLELVLKLQNKQIFT